MNWIEVPAGKYKLVPEDERRSKCQIEINMRYITDFVTAIEYWRSALVYRYDAFISHAPDGPWSHVAPLRVLSFDIECAGRKGIFPEADIDPVIQIANMVTRQGMSIVNILLNPNLNMHIQQANRSRSSGMFSLLIRVRI